MAFINRQDPRVTIAVLYRKNINELIWFWWIKHPISFQIRVRNFLKTENTTFACHVTLFENFENKCTNVNYINTIRIVYLIVLFFCAVFKTKQYIWQTQTTIILPNSTRMLLRKTWYINVNADQQLSDMRLMHKILKSSFLCIEISL